MDDIQTECGLATWGVVRIPWDEIPRWRKAPGPADGLASLSNLKLADEQTVLAMAAILQAAQRADLAPTAFADWGVVVGPRYLGRTRFAQAFSRFRKLGARATSPLIIPTLSQHAVAGTLCLILGCHGPNFGVGGTANAIGETLLNAVSLFDATGCPGVWTVLTAWDPEPATDAVGQRLAPTVGLGIALALTPQAAIGRLRLNFTAPMHADPMGVGSIFELADFLERSAAGLTWRADIRGGVVLEVTPNKCATTLPLRHAG